jgi:hypothetical protein
LLFEFCEIPAVSSVPPWLTEVKFRLLERVAGIALLLRRKTLAVQAGIVVALVVCIVRIGLLQFGDGFVAAIATYPSER